jgi:hypothetical protein
MQLFYYGILVFQLILPPPLPERGAPASGVQVFVLRKVLYPQPAPNSNREDIQTVYAGKAFLNGVQLELVHLLGGFVLLHGFQAPLNRYEFSVILSSLDQNHNAIQN